MDLFYRRFYFRPRKMISLAGEMVRDPQVMRRRLREGRDFLRFLRKHRTPPAGPAHDGARGMKVLVIDAIAPEGIDYLRERGFEVDEVSSKLPREELLARLGTYEAIVTRSSTTVTPEFLAHARRLRILGRAGVGVDNIDVDACSRQGVVVVNAPYGNVVSAAEHTLGMLLALVRKIPSANDALKRLDWDRGIYGAELFRKTAGVIGLGKVGSRVAGPPSRLRDERARL
jgi:D-3-phosphoglycerate dehydrogenase